MLKSNVIGIDLAKNILQICHISKHGELISNKAVGRQKLKQILANQQPAVVAIEGCGSSHYWGRYAEQFGHDVRIISPKKVKGFLQGHKTDANDALAIANASSLANTQPLSNLELIELAKIHLMVRLKNIWCHYSKQIPSFNLSRY